ncbi:hypothetical protein E2C01_033753 [Portunus trituberculatus]|uniref:Uncharacterized protein n=1 Tax=Portunus trituberculatus TaxID=210409 RepID=A0A5B7F3S0_PORTR|nr:hypothetical protein [Portunus trituberculatus]
MCSPDVKNFVQCGSTVSEGVDTKPSPYYSSQVASTSGLWAQPLSATLLHAHVATTIKYLEHKF